MIKSINTKSYLINQVFSFHSGLNGKFGDILVGDKGIEFFNRRNVKDNVQIPWTNIVKVEVLLLFGNVIHGFVIIASNNYRFRFSSKNSKAIVKIIKEHISKDKFEIVEGVFAKMVKFIKILLRS